MGAPHQRRTCALGRSETRSGLVCFHVESGGCSAAAELTTEFPDEHSDIVTESASRVAASNADSSSGSSSSSSTSQSSSSGVTSSGGATSSGGGTSGGGANSTGGATGIRFPRRTASGTSNSQDGAVERQAAPSYV